MVVTKVDRPLKLTLLLLSMHTVMAAAIMSPALPSIEDAFRDTPRADLLAKLVLSLPAIFIAISAPLAGRFIDRHGRLKLLYAGLVAYVLGGTTGLYLNDLYQILIGRIVLGISIGIILTVAITLISDYFEGEARQLFVGLQSAFIGGAGVFFLAFGGVLGDISWRMPFLIYGLALFMIPLVSRYLPEPNFDQRVQTVLPRLNALSWIVFVTAILVMILFYVIPTQLPFVLRDLGVASNALIGLVLAMNALGLVVSALLFGRLKKIMSFAMIYVLGFTMMSIGYWITGNTGSYALIVTAMIIAGFGFGLIIPNTNLWIIELSPLEYRGRNLGALNSFLFFGQFLSPITLEPLILGFGLNTLFIACAVLLLVMAVSFLILKSRLSEMNRRYLVQHLSKSEKG